jgi:Tol biopolymer transport system component/dienelactone hydrolase
LLNNSYTYDNTFAFIVNYKDFSFLGDSSEHLLYISDKDGQFNLCRQKTDFKDKINSSSSQSITHFKNESVRSAFTSPNTKNKNQIVFFADRDGNQNYQIFQINDLFNSSIETLTQNSNVRHEWGSECLSHDGQYIMYSSNESSPSNILIYRYDLGKRLSECITSNKQGWFAPGYWSLDDKFINCVEQVTFSSYVLWVVDVNSKDLIDISLDKENVTYKTGPWSKKYKKGFFFLSDGNKDGFLNLAFYDIDENHFDWEVISKCDIEHVVLCEEKDILVWVENVDGYSKIYIKNLKSQEIFKIDKIPDGVISKINITPDGQKIVFLLSTAISPYDIYVYDFKTDDVKKLTNSFKNSVPYNLMKGPKIVRYNSFDNEPISAFLYLPSEKFMKNDKEKIGAVLSVHGGPTSQERPSYLYGGLYQYILSKGLAVLAPNFRGSTGYGKSFEKKIYHDWAGGELKDLEYAVKWLLSQKWIDKDKIGVFGASFGGFSTLNCVSRLSHYNWKAAVDIVGPSNLVTFTKTAPKHWKRVMAEWVGDPDTEEDFLKERSPITYVDNIKSDLLIIQGAKDPLVVKEESEQMVDKLQKSGKFVEYCVFDDEGHGFTKAKNMVKAYGLAAEFLIKRLI